MKRYATLVVSILVTATILSGVVLMSDYAFANNVVNDVSIIIPVACTMSSTGQNSHNIEINNGTYQADIGTTTLHAFCNDVGGFAIYAAGYTRDVTGGANSNKLIGATTNTAIETGLATSAGDPDASNWAMKLAITQDSGDTTGTNAFVIDSAPNVALPSKAEQGATSASFSQYHVVPNEYVRVAHKNSVTDMVDTIGGAKLTTTYAAYISKTQPADTYSGQVVYTLVHPGNGLAPGVITISNASTMQEVNACPTILPEEEVYIIKDARDNQDYKVAKLKDGKCWMVENLNIAGGTALSSDDTDFDSSYTLPTIRNWTVSDGKLILPASSTSGFDYDGGAFVYNSGNKENCGNGQNTPCYSYYSWDAATLSSGSSVRDEDAPYSICPKGWRLPVSGISSNESWKRGDIYTLATAYGANLENSSSDATNETGASFYNNAGPGTMPNFIFTGIKGSNSLSQSDTGFYWASTSGGYTDIYPVGQRHFGENLNFSSTRVASGDSIRRYGLGVRCVFGD